MGIDLFYSKDAEWFVVIDYYSKYIEVAKLKRTNCRTVIAKLKSIHTRHGILETIYSDNDAQFASYEMKQFNSQLATEHKISSPRYPQSNGMVERHISTMKNIFK